MLANILLVLVLLYSVKIIVFGIATYNAHYPSDRSYRPTVTIIIAARNEQEYIRRCLESLVRLTYPKELLEIVVINDRSEDQTDNIVREYADRFDYVRLLTLTVESDDLRGKVNAVTRGIEASGGEIILFTDADCEVPNRWVEEMVKYYTEPSVGIVAGFTELKSSKWFDAIQTIDWFILFSVAAATIRLKYPVTAVGNNLSVRRDAYNAIGGYRKIPFSVTEDYALFHAITGHTSYHARFPLDQKTLVISEACKDWKQLYRQKKRWFTGGRGMDIRSLLIFVIPYGLNVSLILGLLFAPLWAALTAVVTKGVVDLFLASASMVSFKRWNLVWYFPIFEVYYVLYVLVFPVIVLARKDVVWKERILRNE